MEEMYVIAAIFVDNFFYLCGVNFDEVLQSFQQNMSSQEKVWLLAFIPIYFWLVVVVSSLVK